MQEMLPSSREPDDDQYLQIHQGIAGEQDRQIDREGLRKRDRQDGNGNEFEHAAQRQPAEESGELHDQHFPKRVPERQRDFVAPLPPPVLHATLSAVRSS